MITSHNVLLTSGVVLTVLISATVISYTIRNKFAFVGETQKKTANLIYEPFVNCNCTMICTYVERPYSTKYEHTLCYNRTFLNWYNPWISQLFWDEFWRDMKEVRKLKKHFEAMKITNDPIPIETPTTEPPKGKTKEVRNGGEKPVEFVYSVLVGLLVVSGVVACWEVCKERMKKNETAAAKAQERQCSLAEFTIKRHLRRESQQQTGSHLQRQASLELTAKVTQTLIHQSSLDRALPKNTSEALSSTEPRRNSVPLYLSDIHQVTGGGRSTKRQSMDVSTEDTGLDSKRKSRHFIRRH